MKEWQHKLEVLTDHLVLPAVIVLFFIIVAELFFVEFAEQYHLWLTIADYTIMTIFIGDLIFKYFRVRNIPKFIRTSWLDIIAVFPFFLFFRVFETLLIFTELQKEVRNVQLILHESVEISKGTSEIIKEAEAAGKISRVKTILHMFRSLENSPRLVKAVAFYERPSGKKQVKKIEQEIVNIEKDVMGVPKRVIRKISRKKK
ncbi:MAG TPA: hypothetical protein VJJ79_01605 [Candidatus Nanoarchaeia archaeon]|nr:hypothetical protein [Candidatus Nanoarchaeia archaeon]